MTRNDGFATIGFAFGGFLLGQIAAVIMIVIAKSLANFHGSLSQLLKLGSPPWWFVAAELVGIWIGFGAAIAVVHHRHDVLRGVWRPRLSDVGYVVVGVGLQLVVDVLYAPFHSKSFGAPSQHLFGGASHVGFIVVAFLTAIGAPIVEETLFRGTLVPAFRALFGSDTVRATLLVIVADGLIFGLAHAEWVQLPGLAAVGMVLAWIFLRQRRLWPCIITHASFNALAVISIAQHGGGW
jgi:membrane protease YdiL (CAAX protease family)